MAYFMKTMWETYTLNDVTYNFDHLNEFYMVANDSLGNEKRLIVTYNDHVFTRDPMPNETIELAFPNAARTPFGVFCADRYAMSLTLPAIIQELPTQRIWNLAKTDCYAHVPTVDHNGQNQLYSIIFSLFPIKNPKIPHDFRLHIRSAYICDIKEPDTFGDIRFSHLLTVTSNGNSPSRIFNRNRKKPKL